MRSSDGERETDGFFKPNLEQVLGRLTDFWQRRTPRGIAVIFGGFPNPYFQRYLASNTFEPQGSPAEDIPSNAARWEYWRALNHIHADVRDDNLPVFYATLDFGESLITALVGGEIRFFHRGDGSTYSALKRPVLGDGDTVDKLHFDEHGPWARRVKDVTQHAQEHARGVMGVCPFITMDALNFACEVMGTTRAYTEAAYGGSDEIHEVMEFAIDLNVRFLEMQHRLIDDVAGGAFHFAAQWVPFTGPTPWLSVDSYTCCSPQTYADAGRSYQQRLIDHFGQGVMHYHSSRLDLLLEVAKLKNLLGLSIDGSGRPQDPRPFDVLIEHEDEIRAVAGDTPLMCACTKAEFLHHIAQGSLPGNVRYSVSGVETVEEANALTERAWDYRSPA